MDQVLGNIILYSGFAGITVFVGGLMAHFFNKYFEQGETKEQVLHATVAFGGGIILSAVSLVLIPKGMEELDLIPLLISFTGGAVLFCYIDQLIARRGGDLSALLAMLMDFIPESIVLGAVFAKDGAAATLLAVFIGLQNLPEAFASYGNLRKSGFKAKSSLLILFILSFTGILGALSGYFFLTDLPELTAHLMMFASGGILYLIFQDIAPESKLKSRFFPPLGAALGFAIGMIGEKLL